ncbi:class I SAM-dependent methyltransferase [Clostridium sp. SHJSY1]|uniref:class I SAM-dependent methyltransferase n=1 Tax=Clostridium sp. SHJSY1 TaxID=2942483 RepID=UPI00287618BF|nr:class I SAM-dependent methyltransferase [Clostridium sp. SHJSY1]MDS0526753.1 class I SAM-dependent methyltransferase [Clostridium sp. SHJSY1]
MNRKVINWNWENVDAQKSFLEWQGMPDEKVTREEVSKIESILNIHPPLKILDIGCGVGRHSIEFAQRGYDVRGIDVAETYLNQAIERAKILNLNITFELERGSQIAECKAYDFVIAYYHTLGFMEDKELEIQLSNIYNSIKEGGKFLLRTAGPQIIPSIIQEKRRDWAEKDKKYILSEKFIEDGYRIENCIMIDTIKDEIIEYRERQRAFSFQDVINLLSDSGFSNIDCYKDLDGSFADDEEFGVYVCTK